MKQIIISVLVIASAVGLIAIAFTFNQVSQENIRLTSDLQYRSTLLAESLRESIEPNVVTASESAAFLRSVVEKFSNRERLLGMAVFDHTGSIIAMSTGISQDLNSAQEIATDAMDEDAVNSDFATYDNKRIHLLAIPLHDQNRIVGSLMIIQNANYINSRLSEIWLNNLIRIFIQIFLVTIAVLLVIRWLIFQPINNLTESLRAARTGNKIKRTTLVNSLFFQPLSNEISSIRRSLVEARLAASEEARLNLEKMDSPWTGERLKEFVKTLLKNRTIVVVSNREPYIHTKSGNKIEYHFPASGMATAVEPIMQATGGTWIAHGSGAADRLVVDKNDRVKVPPDDPKYTLRRVWLTPEEEQGYYYGFSNEGLWALSHIAHNRPIFRKEDWNDYYEVNNKFAQAVLKEIKHLKKPIILIQDFHFALLPRLIKNKRPDATIAIFWHVPWVSAESFSICPWKKEILDGMLGADLIGFHTQLHCNNFIDTVGHELESLIDFEQFSITRDQHTTFVKPFPISIAFSNGQERISPTPKDLEKNHQILENLGVNTTHIGLGVDRLDYTKGILERLKAIEIFFTKYPQYHGKFTFIQISAPSREKIKKYQEFAQEVKDEVDRINSLFKTKKWQPIILLKKFHTHKEVYAYYRLSNVCLVTSLHDGMNLVAKEYIAAREDQQGVLILSQFTGASRELKEALIVNPYNAEQTAEAIKTALEMKPAEQTKRMKKLREKIRSYNVYRWSAELLKNISLLE